MNAKILVISGHPSCSSFTAAIAESYAEGARSVGGTVQVLHLGELTFDPSLHDGYGKVMPLEPDLQAAQKAIEAARHLVICYPQWWGSAPAVLKGFVDRTFLPGFAFRYHEKGPFWDKLLKGKTGELWLMSDSPWMWFFFKYWNSPIRWLKTATLEFCGVKPVKVHVVDRVRFLTPEQRTQRLAQAHRAGVEAAGRAGAR